MDLQEAYVEFAQRLFHWAMDDCRREVAADYQLLRTIRSRGAGRTLAYLETLLLEKRLPVGQTLVKLWFQRMRHLIEGATLSQEERSILEVVRFEVLKPRDPYVYLADVTPKRSRVDLRDFRNEVVRIVTADLGVKPQRSPSLCWMFIQDIGDWKLYTELDFGGRWGPQVRYSQYVDRRDLTLDNVAVIKELFRSRAFPIGFMELLGLGETSWDIPYYHDAAELSESLLRVLKHMIDALPVLTRGLDC